ncbi:MAG: 5'-nucleotidase C-terminal domain-containing protein [Mucinivorans sp.]
MRLFLSIFCSLIISLTATSQSITRSVRVAPLAIFPFDPLSGRYLAQSLSPVATFVDAWREEGSKIELEIYDTLLVKGYKIYAQLEDSTLIDRVVSYLKSTITSRDTVNIYSTNIYDFPPSRDFLAHFESDIQHIKRFFATPIHKLTDCHRFDPYAPSNFSRLMHDFQLSVSGANLSLFAPPRLDAAMEKEIFISSIYNLLYFDNQLVTVNMTGLEIKNLLEKIYEARYYTLKNEQSDLLRTTLPPSMHSSLAGTPFSVNLTRRNGAKIEDLTLDQKAIYKVAMNSFAAQKLDKAMVHIGDYRTLLIKYLQQAKTPQNHEDWHLKPQRWVDEIKARENLQIYGN